MTTIDQKLLAALKDLLGDRPSVQNYICVRCGRDYHDVDELAIETGDCPSDDCPSYHARAAIAEAEAAIAATAHPLLVPAGTPLVAGELYVQLTHGRKDPAEEMYGWGFVGPTFGPLARVVQTYLSTIRLHGADGGELWLETRDDMIVWDGSYYGDMSIFSAGKHDHG